ncbi:MAG: hypothetical protein EP302_02030, partial [Bacteroidetes bacterium]
MNFKPLRDRGDLNPGKRTQEKIQNFRELLLALEDRGLTEVVVQALNLKIRALNEMQGPEKEYRKALVNTGYKILKFLEKEHKSPQKPLPGKRAGNWTLRPGFKLPYRIDLGNVYIGALLT